MTTQHKTTSDSGFLSFEALLVLAFFIIMIGVIATQSDKLFSGSRLSQMQQALNTINLEVQALYSSSSSYSGLDNALVIKSGLIPNKLLKGGKIQTPWGGEITLSSSSGDTRFSIKLSKIRESDCAKLATYQLDMWESVEVNGSSLTRDSSVSDAIQSCASNDANTVTYYSR